VDQSTALPRTRLSLAILWQAGLLLAPGLLLLSPPASGTMLLVPIGPASAATVEAVGRSGGGRMGGTGPLPGSRFVDGERATLLPAALAHGMVLISLEPRICGEFTGTPE
jgi:hypothetical protein